MGCPTFELRAASETRGSIPVPVYVVAGLDFVK